MDPEKDSLEPQDESQPDASDLDSSSEPTDDDDLQAIIDKARGATSPSPKEETPADEANEPEESDPVAAAKAEAERILAEANAQAEEIRKGQAQTPETPDADQTPLQTLRQSWEAEKAEIEKGWKEVEAPGEERLVRFIDTMIGHLEEMGSRLTELNQVADSFQNLERDNEVRQLAGSATSAVAIIKSKFDAEVDQKAIIASLERGLPAYAALNGIDLNDLRGKLTPEILAEAFELANRSKLKPRTQRQPAPTAELPDIHRGGRSRQRTEPKTEDEELQEIIDQARAAKR